MTNVSGIHNNCYNILNVLFYKWTFYKESSPRTKEKSTNYRKENSDVTHLD